MKWKTLCLTAALTAVLAAVPAYALDYTVDAPEDYLFGRPTQCGNGHRVRRGQC